MIWLAVVAALLAGSEVISAFLDPRGYRARTGRAARDGFLAVPRLLLWLWKRTGPPPGPLERAGKTVAQLEAELLGPLALTTAGVVAQAERRAIAQAFPLAWDPAQITVVRNSGDPFADHAARTAAQITRSFAIPPVAVPPVPPSEQVALARERVLQAKKQSPVVHGEQPGPGWIEITVIGDRERSWVAGPEARRTLLMRLKDQQDKLSDLKRQRREMLRLSEAILAQSEGRAFTEAEAHALDVYFDRVIELDAELTQLDSIIRLLARSHAE